MLEKGGSHPSPWLRHAMSGSELQPENSMEHNKAFIWYTVDNFFKKSEVIKGITEQWALLLLLRN